MSTRSYLALAAIISTLACASAPQGPTEEELLIRRVHHWQTEVEMAETDAERQVAITMFQAAREDLANYRAQHQRCVAFRLHNGSVVERCD